MRKIVFLDADTIGSDISLEPIAAQGELVTYPFTKPEVLYSSIHFHVCQRKHSIFLVII